MGNQITTQELYQNLRDLSQEAYDVYRERGNCLEYSKLHKEYVEFRDSIDPNLSIALKKAARWIQDNHAYVFFNSSWSNSYRLDNVMYRYLGFSTYHKEPEAGIPFRASSVSPKEMILGGFKYYKEQLARESGVSSDVGVDHFSYTDQQIIKMLKDIESYDDNLNKVI